MFVYLCHSLNIILSYRIVNSQFKLGNFPSNFAAFRKAYPNFPMNYIVQVFHYTHDYPIPHPRSAVILIMTKQNCASQNITSRLVLIIELLRASRFVSLLIAATLFFPNNNRNTSTLSLANTHTLSLSLPVALWSRPQHADLSNGQ